MIQAPWVQTHFSSPNAVVIYFFLLLILQPWLESRPAAAGVWIRINSIIQFKTPFSRGRAWSSTNGSSLAAFGNGTWIVPCVLKYSLFWWKVDRILYLICLLVVSNAFFSRLLKRMISWRFPPTHCNTTTHSRWDEHFHLHQFPLSLRGGWK